MKGLDRKVLTYSDGAWWVRVESTALETERGPDKYEDDRIGVYMRYAKDRLIGYEVNMREQPRDMICGEYFVFLPYSKTTSNNLTVLYADHHFRVFSIGEGDELNYLILIRNGSVDVPDWCTSHDIIEDG